MVTTGELGAIIQELQLVDVGDAASYLGEEAQVVEEAATSVSTTLALVTNTAHLATCDCLSCQLVHA
jgi:hypothetical protein